MECLRPPLGALDALGGPARGFRGGPQTIEFFKKKPEK